MFGAFGVFRFRVPGSGGCVWGGGWRGCAGLMAAGEPVTPGALRGYGGGGAHGNGVVCPGESGVLCAVESGVTVGPSPGS